MSNRDSPSKVIATNRRAAHDYEVLESLEAGLVLRGTEIKSLRVGRVNLREAYARIEHGETWLLGAHIAPYEAGNRYNHDPQRPRKLLLHRQQIARLAGMVAQRGLTLVPLKLYIKNDVAKLELAVARGRRAFDKRAVLAEREAQREMERALKVSTLPRRVR